MRALVAAFALLLAMPFAPSLALGPVAVHAAPADASWLPVLAPWLGSAPATHDVPPEQALTDLAAFYPILPQDLSPIDALPPSVQAPIGGILAAMADAERDRATMLQAGVPIASDAFNAAMRGHAAAITAAVDAALPALHARASHVAHGLGPQPVRVDIPILLNYDEQGDNVYVRDYALSIDLVGNDLYDNHAGGSLFIVGPLGDPSRMDPLIFFDQLQIPLFAAGGEWESGTASMSASVNLDLAGSDVYGVMRTPGVMDSPCTSDLLVRRVGVQGAGLAGVGFLLDTEGDDTYIAKTFAQGSGHPGGVGLLVDQAGNDHYLAVRNAQGNGILGGGLGILLDQEGDDDYAQYIPGPDAAAGKTGGVLNDQLLCDAEPRHLQGASLLFSEGVLIDQSGDDSYQAGVKSQGYGTASAALFLDQGGLDDYHGYPGHADGATGVQNVVGVFVDQA